MVAVPGTTSAETISAIIADEMAIGMINNKTTAVRIILFRAGKSGTLSNLVVCWLCARDGCEFVWMWRLYPARRPIPAPIHSLRN